MKPLLYYLGVHRRVPSGGVTVAMALACLDHLLGQNARRRAVGFWSPKALERMGCAAWLEQRGR